MKTYRKLQRQGSKDPLPCHFSNIVDSIKRILGNGSQNPADYKGADSYAEKYLAYNLRRKEATPYSGVVDEKARRQETLDGFLKREWLNGTLNATRTYGYDVATDSYKSDELGLRICYEARNIIREILGDTPDYEFVAQAADFGNGASATLRRSEAQRPCKFGHKLSATRGLLSIGEKLITDSPCWTALQGSVPGTMYCDSAGRTSSLLQTMKVVSGGVLDFVPKTADIDRIIIKEPELNGFVQKGIGRLMRRQLRSYKRFVPDGIDLNTSGDLNSSLAQAGSLQGHIGTVDGERASDSITLSAVDFLLPPAWYQLLLVARSPYVLIGQKWHRLQMMSGMGNGFTFELESIIFYALGVASCKWSKLPFAELYVSIHGDDLTVPSDVMWHIREAYASLGITVNKSKSFGEGPFRESCGGHYFNGHSVKPFYVKTSTGLRRGDWFWLANSLLLWLSERTEGYLTSHKGKDLVEHLLYLRDFATSYNRNESYWRTPFDRSRRAGLYSLAPTSTGASYKVRNVVDKPKELVYQDENAYVAWLHRPQVSERLPGIFGSNESDAYSYTSEVIEVERWVRFNTWHGAPYGVGWSHLWTCLRHHTGRRK